MSGTAFFRPRRPCLFFSGVGDMLIVGCIVGSITVVTVVTLMGGMASVGESIGAVMM